MPWLPQSGHKSAWSVPHNWQDEMVEKAKDEPATRQLFGQCGKRFFVFFFLVFLVRFSLRPHNLANKQKTVDQKLRLAMRVQRVTEAAEKPKEMTHQIRQYHLPGPKGEPKRPKLVSVH